MILVKPSYCVLTMIDRFDEILERIESAGRICYKSEEKITPGSAEKFIKRIIKSGHHSVIEHENISVRFICDRGVTHEIVRHRLCAYSQECVVGNTEIRKGLTIEDLYNRKHGTCYDRTHNKTVSLRSVDADGNIIANSFVDVFYKGRAEIFEMKTKLGYTIRCTKKHRFLTPDGLYEELGALHPGDFVSVNGRPCLLRIDDNNLSDLYLNKKMTPLDISERLNVPYRTVLRRLHALNIFSKYLNDYNKEKYCKNHIEKSYKKMKTVIQQQYDGGRIVWNKGIKEGEYPSVDKQAKSLREHHHNNQPGLLNSNWAGGPTKYREAQLLKKEINRCELCRASDLRLEVHHIDEDITNNETENLLKVCCHCHHILHHGWYVGKQSMPDMIVSITYEGEEEVFDLQMADPYNNYIANGFITHNSTRYCNYKGGVTFVIPPWTKWSSGDYTADIVDEIFVEENVEGDEYDCDLEWFSAMNQAENFYLKLLKYGWSPQQARSVLPNSLKTEIVMTANIREWRHVLKLRCSKAAHPQMRELMIPLLKDFQAMMPVLFGDIEKE